jgi:hypothetical protein
VAGLKELTLVLGRTNGPYLFFRRTASSLNTGFRVFTSAAAVVPPVAGRLNSDERPGRGGVGEDDCNAAALTSGNTIRSLMAIHVCRRLGERLVLYSEGQHI